MKSIKAKLDDLLTPANLHEEMDELFRLAGGSGRFNSRDELLNHLGEGALLNVGVLAGKAMALPHGEYMVWLTDAGRTVLVPTSAPRGGDVLTKSEGDKYEVHTADLAKNWNRLSRIIHEEEESGGGFDRGQDHYDDAPEFRPDGPYTFGSEVTRTELWQAMQDRNIGVEQLADMVGVDKSTISRLLRTVKTGVQGDPGGRNPSAETALKVAKALGVPVEVVMPPEDELLDNNRQKTSGSGKGGAGSVGRRGSKAYQGGE